MKHNNIHIIGVREREDTEQGIENPFAEIMIENSHKPDKANEKKKKKTKQKSRKYRQSQKR